MKSQPLNLTPVLETRQNRQRITAIIEADGSGSGALLGFMKRATAGSTEAGWDNWDNWTDGAEHADSDSG